MSISDRIQKIQQTGQTSKSLKSDSVSSLISENTGSLHTLEADTGTKWKSENLCIAYC